MKTGRYSFSQLLNSPEIEQIIIPEIQRDYVWTRRNVDRFLNSIFTKYESKTKLNLSIQTDDGIISGQMFNYLSKEYSRLQFSTKIGFIYAYHDVDYPGKFFLIDGQQRITTLFLLLLALYSRQQDKWEYFRQHYFTLNLPKLDYRVREITHDFMVSLINHEISNPQKDFKKDPSYYSNIYDNDVTTKTINVNYKEIKRIINEREGCLVINDFIDYIENYVEFNFFDTNISSQGERLYIYMNSRGESLSYQETVKALLISKCKEEEKSGFGIQWEKWQDFFWQHRGANINDDDGLRNFLKWSVVLHMCSIANVILKDAEKRGIRKQTENEIKEDYIRVEIDKEKKNVQFEEYIKNYIKNNDSFTTDWLNKVMAAVVQLSTFIENGDEVFVNDTWLSATQSTIEYVTVLGELRYIMRFPNADIKMIKRLGMFLKNKTYDGTRRKNPDTTIIATISMVNSIPQENFMETDSYPLCSPFDQKVFSLINQNDEWEHALELFVKDPQLETFLEGNADCLLSCGEIPEEFEKNIITFKNKLYYQKDEDNGSLRKDLLKYGDYRIDEGGGSHHLTRPEKLSRYNWITNDDYWRIALNDKDFVENNLKPFLAEEAPSIEYDDWVKWFIDDDFNLFIGKYKFLFSDKNTISRIILLNGSQAGEYNSWYMEIMMFQQLYKKILKCDNIWRYKYDTCVIPFVLNNGEFVHVKETDPFEQLSNYFIDIVFTWKEDGKSQWEMALGKRNNEVNEKENNCGFVKKDSKYWKTIYENDLNINLKENIQRLISNLIELEKSDIPEYVKYFFE